MTEHRTDWHRLTVRGHHAEEVALGWLDDDIWYLDRIADGRAYAYHHNVTDLGPVDVLVLPAPSGPVVKHTWGWLCGDTEAEDLDDAMGWEDELPQHIADSRAIAAHIRGLPTPTLAEDVATVRAWEIDEGANYPSEEMARILVAVYAKESK